MRIPANVAVRAAAAAAPKMARQGDYPAPQAGGKFILSGNGADGVGFVQTAEFSGSEITWGLQAKVEGAPTWITSNEKTLYINNENAEKMSRYNLETASNGTQILSAVELSEGDAADEEEVLGQVHMAFNKDKTRLVTAAYGAGNVAVYDVEGDNFELIEVISGTQSNATAAESNPHQVLLDPTGANFVIPNLGADTILLVTESDSGSYDVVHHAAEKGCGPRHGIFSPPGAEKPTHYYMTCELSGEVASYAVSYDESGKIALDHMGSQPSSDRGVDSFPSEPLITADGLNLYVGNRFVERLNRTEDSISRFSIDPVHLLVKKGEYDTDGLTPRSLSLSCNDACLAIAYQGPQSETPDLSGVGLSIRSIGPEGHLNAVPLATAGLKHFGGGVFFIEELSS